jgi:membrane dipeptidase
VLETSERPVFASHSCCRSIQDHTRNMTDDMITSMAQAGGAININFVSGFVWDESTAENPPPGKPPASELIDPFDFLTKKAPGQSPPLSRLMDQFDHAIKLAGPAHVGIGSDYDGASHFPIGLDDISRMPLVTQAYSTVITRRKSSRAFWAQTTYACWARRFSRRTAIFEGKLANR